ncbi:MAG: hypothetical protein Q8M78_05235, partial [Burkholderiaceae bacterium]|nr:hypothetical protein [Burkholderiaceae bacterium]
MPHFAPPPPSTWARWPARLIHLGLWLASLLLPAVMAQAADWKTTADHSKFKELKGPFKSGSEVTKACLGCHTEAAKQVMDTRHWTWEYT